ncbi:hypothetical protein MMC11_004196 [Xylographa trunciseda]|nr:hypothetical protein [Xylographa trunciseda]
MSSHTIGLSLPKILFLPVTGTWTLPFAAYLLLLSNRVVYHRLKHEKYLGYKLAQEASSDEQSNPDPLHLASRAHQNFLENVPLAFIFTLVAELNGGNKKLLNYGMAALLALRILHVEVGMYGQDTTPLKPPQWTEDRSGIELVTPPICDHCVDDWEIAENAASSSKNLRPGAQMNLRIRTEDLNSASSDILHQMRRAGDVDCHTSKSRHASTISKKRSRPEDKFLSEINLPKRQKNPRLADISERGMSSSDRLITRPTHVSIFTPLELDSSFSPTQPRPLPKWMSQLPSSRVKDSVYRKSSSPVYLPSQREGLSQDDSPVSTKPTEDLVVPTTQPSPPHKVSPAHYSPTLEAVESEPRIQRAQSVPERHIVPPKPLAAFPFFQNPRAPLIPAVESSWGSAPSSGMTPYRGLPPAAEKKTPSPKGGRQEVLQSNEFNEKYSVQMQQNDIKSDKICPICEDTIANSADEDAVEWRRRLSLQDATEGLVMGLNDHVYHITCIQCRACRQPFRSKDSMTDWTWVGSSSPYHRTCMVQGAKPMLERLRRRLSMAGLTAGHPSKQDPNSQMLPGLSRPAPHVLQQTKPPSEVMPTFKKPEYLKSLPSLFSTRTGPEPCASCGHALLATESVPGPNMTKHHVACLSACVQCGMDFGGKGTKWYAYGRRGLIRALCHDCWATGRNKHGPEGR